MRSQGATLPDYPKATVTLWAAVLGLVLLRAYAHRGSSSASPEPAPPKGGKVDRGFSEKQHADAKDAMAQEGRGREASSPTQIPRRGWKDVLLRTYDEFGKDRVMSVAAGVTYYALLALFPAVAALVSVYGFFADPMSIQEHLTVMSGVLPGGAVEVIGDQVGRIASQGESTLGFSFLIGLLISLWSANAGMKAIFDALNIVYDEEEKRGFFKLNMISLTFTLGAIVFLLASVGGIVIVPILLRFVGLGDASAWLVSIGRWPALLACLVFCLAILYRFGPSRDKAKWKWVTPGGLVAAALWLAVSLLFSWYVSNFGNYNATYGSLGAIIGFMTWIWLSAIVVLLGAEINAEMEHQTAHDTTEGPPEPLGGRGARMADTIGVAKA